MKKMFLLFSHDLTQTQIDDGKENLKIDIFVSLPNNLQKAWSNIPSDTLSIKEYLLPFCDFLVEETNLEDIVLIQGDFGAVYQMVNFAKALGLKTVYATTRRVIEEVVIDNKTVKKSIFEHRRFREYGI
jgi:hypothetical protein